jgi:hypothetical protein
MRFGKLYDPAVFFFFPLVSFNNQEPGILRSDILKRYELTVVNKIK